VPLVLLFLPAALWSLATVRRRAEPASA
jgi:hypothetical protein